MTTTPATIETDDASVIKYIGGRKFTISVFAILTTSVLTYLDILEPVHYTTIVCNVVTAFIAMNVIQKRFT